MAQGEGSIQGGTGSQIGALHRWGDYSSMSVDPSDDCTFWYTNEYYETTNGSMWSTRVGSFRFPGCGPSGPALSIGDIVTREGEDAVFTVQLSPASDETVSVDYATEPGTAGSEDFQAASGTLTFAPGETSQEFSVPVALDADREPNETFSALLSNPVNAEVRAVRGTATIQGEVTSAPGTGRPDGAIKTAGSGFRGARVYNATGWHQTQRAKLRAGRTRRFVIRIHNSGTARQRYVVRGPGSSPTFGVEYRTGGTHRLVTKQVVKGRYAVWVPAGRDRVLRLVVSAGRRAHRGWRRGFLVVTAPAGAGAHRDAVKAVVTVRKRH
jgi:hypothetical protein